MYYECKTHIFFFCFCYTLNFDGLIRKLTETADVTHFAWSSIIIMIIAFFSQPPSMFSFSLIFFSFKWILNLGATALTLFFATSNCMFSFCCLAKKIKTTKDRFHHRMKWRSNGETSHFYTEWFWAIHCI